MFNHSFLQRPFLLLLAIFGFGISALPLVSNAQTLTWSNPYEISWIQVGGQLNGVGGVGTAVWNNKLYVAYADNSLNG